MKLNVKSQEPTYLEIEFIDEDISFLHALREVLVAKKEVEFVAAKIDHPQIGNPTLILRTKKEDAVDVLRAALKELKKQLSEFKEELKSAKKPKSK
jgi:DNA-directed RNA polymerase subunit L